MWISELTGQDMRRIIVLATLTTRPHESHDQISMMLGGHMACSCQKPWLTPPAPSSKVGGAYPNRRLPKRGERKLVSVQRSVDSPPVFTVCRDHNCHIYIGGMVGSQEFSTEEARNRSWGFNDWGLLSRRVSKEGKTLRKWNKDELRSICHGLWRWCLSKKL